MIKISAISPHSKTVFLRFAQIFLLLLILAFGPETLAQEDKDLREKDVPASIRNYIQANYPEAKRLKYYKETEGDTVFYQPTFTFNKDRYSLLMFADGRVYETEILISFDELPALIGEKIKQDLHKRYIKYSIYSTEEVNPKEELKYEVKVRARKENQRGYYEVFYDKNGIYLMEKEEILKSIPSNSGF